MRLNQVTFTDAKPVDGYGPGFFRIGGDVFEGAVLTGPAGPANWGGYADAQPLLELADEIDVLLIGTGKDMAPHSPIFAHPAGECRSRRRSHEFTGCVPHLQCLAL